MAGNSRAIASHFMAIRKEGGRRREGDREEGVVEREGDREEGVGEREGMSRMGWREKRRI